MGSVTIRPLTPNDMQQMGQLLATRDGIDSATAARRLEILSWLAFENPYADDEPTYFIAEKSDQIIAHIAKMPMMFSYDGKPQKGYFVHDLYVHPDHRDKGAGFFISMRLYRTIEQSMDSFGFLIWTNEINLEMQKRRGYLETWADRYRKFFNPYPIAQKFVRSDALARFVSLSLGWLLHAADALLLMLMPSGVPVRKIDALDDRFDHLEGALINDIGICPWPSCQYLNWRYMKMPYGEMEMFVAEKDGRILGYAVVCVVSAGAHRDGVIIDIMAAPDDSKTIGSLLRTIVKYMRIQKVASIRCCLTDPRWIRIFKRWLFVRNIFEREPVMIANLNKHPDKSRLEDISNWHITYGTSDAFIFEPLI